MATIRLIHSDVEEARRAGDSLARAGHDVDCSPMDQRSFRALRENPPDVIVIDLSRAYAQGRDLGVLLRRARGTRDVPLVFAGGEPAKVERVRGLLPDASFTTWDRVRGSVTRALRVPPGDPVVPESAFAAYAGTPLAKKLGIKPGAVVVLVGAPEGFEEQLGPLPPDVALRRGARGRCDLAVWFARSQAEVERRVVGLGEFAGRDGLWIAWPKRSSGVASDLSQVTVRKIGLASGLVDYKVCSVDETWSALRFTTREREGRS